MIKFPLVVSGVIFFLFLLSLLCSPSPSPCVAAEVGAVTTKKKKTHHQLKLQSTPTPTPQLDICAASSDGGLTFVAVPGPRNLVPGSVEYKAYQQFLSDPLTEEQEEEEEEEEKDKDTSDNKTISSLFEEQVLLLAPPIPSSLFAAISESATIWGCGRSIESTASLGFDKLWVSVRTETSLQREWKRRGRRRRRRQQSPAPAAPNAPADVAAGQARAAGFLEGTLSKNRTLEFLGNFAMWELYDVVLLTPLAKYFDSWDSYVHQQIVANPTDPYWVHVDLTLTQLQGQIAGFNAALEPAQHQYKIPSNQFLYLLNSIMELQDIAESLNMTESSIIRGSSSSSSIRALLDSQLMAPRPQRCSALVKLLDGNSDVLASHATWSTFVGMYRVFKRISIPFAASSAVAATTVSFTSYPLLLFSMDDFYLSSAGLMITETTNNVFERSLYAHVQPNTVSTWMRAIVSSRLASTPAEWAALFARHNSGTYNCQWIVVHLSKFVPQQQGLPSGFLHILEQIPGTIVSKDQTNFLSEHRFWPSYNVPFYPEIFNLSGYPRMYNNTHSPQYTYDHCARANIFRRDAPGVQSVSDLRKLMRSNNYTADPLSHGNPAWAIASRYDLLPAGNSDRQAFGAIDAKVTSASYWKADLRFDAVAGPTDESVPAFQWFPSDFELDPHLGMPNKYTFAWQDDVLHVQ